MKNLIIIFALMCMPLCAITLGTTVSEEHKGKLRKWDSASFKPDMLAAIAGKGGDLQYIRVSHRLAAGYYGIVVNAQEKGAIVQEQSLRLLPVESQNS